MAKQADAAPPGAAHVFISMLPDMVKISGGGSQGKKWPTAFRLRGRNITAQVRLEGVVSALPSASGGNYVLDDGTGAQSFTLQKFCRFDSKLFKVAEPYAIVGRFKSTAKPVVVTHVYRLPGTPVSRRELWQLRVRHLWELSDE